MWAVATWAKNKSWIKTGFNVNMVHLRRTQTKQTVLRMYMQQ